MLMRNKYWMIKLEKQNNKQIQSYKENVESPMPVSAKRVFICKRIPKADYDLTNVLQLLIYQVTLDSSFKVSRISNLSIEYYLHAVI